MFLLLINGYITEDVDSVLIAKNKIVKIGTSANLKKIVGAGTKIIDLEGRKVLPGLIDSHTHLVPYGLELLRPRLHEAKNPTDVIDIIKSFIDKRHPSGIVIAEGYDDSNWDDELNKNLLDRAFSYIPVAARRICGHKTVANSKVLEKLPKRLKSVDWETGIMLEKPSIKLSQYFPPSPERLDKALNIAAEKALSFGITTIHDIVTGDYLHCYLNKKRITPRVRAYIQLDEGKYLPKIGITSGFGNEFIKIMGMKIFLDGSIGARTAAVSKAYLDTKKRGRLLVSRKKLHSYLTQAEKSSLQLMIHAIGDRAIKEVINLPVGEENPLRHRIEHAEILDDRSVEIIRMKNFMISVQPNFMAQWSEPNGLYEKALGKERMNYMNRFKTIVSKGIRMGIGTDCMPLDPKMVLAGAMKHPIVKERIAFETIIDHYTNGSAYLAFDEENLGKIEEGYLADLIVLDGKEEELNIYITILNGEIINDQTLDQN